MNPHLPHIALAALLALAAPAAPAQQNSCAVPGVTIDEDEAGDSVDGNDFSDILSFSGAETPEREGRIVFTLKMAGLSQVPPGLRWVARFSLPTPPPNGDEDWFLGMTTEDNPTPRFVYGTTGVKPAGAPAGARLFTVLGDLAEGSGYDADGTITLIVDKAALGNPAPGTVIVPVDEFVRTVVTPQNNGILDEGTGTGFYEVRGTADCTADKSGLSALFAGGLAPGLLLALAGFAALRRR